MAPIHFPARPRLLPLSGRLLSLSQPIPLLACPPVTVSVLDRRIPQIAIALLNEGAVLDPVQHRLCYLSFGSSDASPMLTISLDSVPYLRFVPASLEPGYAFDLFHPCFGSRCHDDSTAVIIPLHPTDLPFLVLPILWLSCPQLLPVTYK